MKQGWRRGSKGWRSSESTRLPMWPGCKSRRRRHMWVEFVVGSLIFSERFFSGNPDFPSPQKPTIPNSNSIWNARTRLNEFIRTLKCFVGKQITKSYKLHATGCANERKMLGLVGQRCCVRLHGAKAHWWVRVKIPHSLIRAKRISEQDNWRSLPTFSIKSQMIALLKYSMVVHSIPCQRNSTYFSSNSL